MNTHPGDNEIQEYALFLSDEVHTHIANCQQCQEKVSKYQQLNQALSRHIAQVPDFKLADIVMARIAERAPRRRNSEKNAAIASGLIGIGVLLIISWYAGIHTALTGNTLMLLAAGSLLLLGFLFFVQLKNFRKIMQSTNNNTTLQPN